MKNLLVIRFSALGDVAMCVPVVDALARQFPDLHITFLTRPFMRPLFAAMPENVEFRGADIKGEYAGIGGLNRLAKELRATGIDGVADLHDVLRSKFLRMRFALWGTPTAHIDKGRSERRALVKHQINRPLATSFDRYRHVFLQLGFDVNIDFDRIEAAHLPDISSLLPTRAAGERWIGFAPFAAHEGKIYPLERAERLAALLLEEGTADRLFLFGSASEMQQLRTSWTSLPADRLSYAVDCAHDLGEELALMSRLNAMISMDSANMHLASLVGVPVVSIWGATHPHAGFLGYRQHIENVVELPLDCRPCSIYGERACRFGDYRCMSRIEPAEIAKTVRHTLEKAEKSISQIPKSHPHDTATSTGLHQPKLSKFDQRRQ